MASRRARELFKKIPKEAVVLFDCDNTTDIRPTNTIIDERDKVYTGNTVTLQYGDQQLTAKIIKLSDDRTVLTEAQRQLCAQLDAQVREPPKKRPKTTSAALLGVSEFPECESISNSVDALLDDTCVESEFPREAAELPLVSTPVNPTTRPPPVEFNTPEPSVHKACISHDKIREIMRECLLESERKNTEKWLKYEQNVIQLQHQNLEYKQRLLQCEQKIQDQEGRVRQCEEQIQIRDEKIRDLEEQIANRENAPGKPKIRPDLSDIKLTALDIEKTNEHDTNAPSPTLTPEETIKVKTFARSKRIFVANLTRKMYSMEERIRDCNVSGTRNRPAISPTKTRYERICRYTAQQYNCNLDASLQTDVRKTIDDTNRRFRDDLKIRKFKRTETAPGNIAQYNFDDN